MGENWAAIAGEVKAALDDNGFDCVLSKRTQVQETPWDMDADTFTNHDVKVIDTGIKTRYGAGMVVQRIRVLLMSADVEPAKGDRITVAGVVHEIGAIMPIAPAGVAVAYKVELVA